MRVKHVKFKVNKPGEVLRFQSEVLQKPDTTLELNWSLGMGPCGRWVESLVVDITLAVVTIKQTSYVEDHTALTMAATAHLIETEGQWLQGPGPEFAEKLQRNVKTQEIKTFIYKLEDVRAVSKQLRWAGFKDPHIYRESPFKIPFKIHIYIYSLS